MKIVHIDELPVQSRQPRGREGKSVKTSAIMQGDPSRLDNFNFQFNPSLPMNVVPLNESIARLTSIRHIV